MFRSILGMLLLPLVVECVCLCNKRQNTAFCTNPSYVGGSLRTCVQVTFVQPLPCATIQRLCDAHRQLLSISYIDNVCPTISCFESHNLALIDNCCRPKNNSGPLTTPKWKPPKVFTVPTTTPSNASTDNSTSPRDVVSPPAEQFDSIMIGGICVGAGVFLVGIPLCGVCLCRRYRRRSPRRATRHDVRLTNFETVCGQRSGNSVLSNKSVEKDKNSDQNSCTSGSEDSLFGANFQQAAQGTSASYKRFNVKNV